LSGHAKVLGKCKTLTTDVGIEIYLKRLELYKFSVSRRFFKVKKKIGAICFFVSCILYINYRVKKLPLKCGQK
jgi:hypothetical protein